jgi:uncharacterized protein (DUF736 family)
VSMVIAKCRRAGDGFALSFNSLGLRLDARMERRDKGANYAVIGPDDSELGAAWLKSGEFGDYLSVRLDCPTLPGPINATMKMTPTADGVYLLRWQRRDQPRGNGAVTHGGGDSGAA